METGRLRAQIAVLFFLSGVSGLVYEVAWVRALGNLFGNTVQSASIVTSVFMGGLGLGSYVAGGWSDRHTRSGSGAGLLRAYGVAELGVAVCALLLAWGLPHLGALSATLGTYARDSEGWFEPSTGSVVLRALLAIALLLPPTFLMGATFTLLVRRTLLADIRDAGRGVGLLYGVNTAGAAVGALLTDLVLVARIGLFRTQALAAAIQVAVGLMALQIARTPARDTAELSAAAPVPAEAEGGDRSATSTTLIAGSAGLFLSGFAALGTEMVWFRGLSAALGAFRAVFSIVLAAILVGMTVGSLVGGFVTARYRRPLSVFLITQALFAISTLIFAGTFTPLRPMVPVPTVILSIVRVVLVPSLFLGFSMPVVNALVQDVRAVVGARVGRLYFANAAGSVLGSIVAGFVLAPHVGSQVSLGIFAACAAAAPLALVFADSQATPPRVSLLVALGLALPILAGWFALPPAYLLSRFLQPVPAEERVLALDEGLNEVVAVSQGPEGPRSLMTNGHRMSGTTLRMQRYMRAFVHIPMLMMEHPTSVLVICFGVGNTLNAASLYDSVKELELADLSKNVLRHAGYFASTNGDVIHDPRLTVFVDDGREHLRTVPTERYDLITLEPPPIAFAGVSSLYSREFYELARSRLKEGGYMSQWLPIYQVPAETTLELVRAFLDVYPGAVLLSGEWQELVLVGKRGGPVTFDLDRAVAVLEAEPRVGDDLAHVHMGSLVEIVGAFVANGDTLRNVTAHVAPLTDDRPTMEYTMWAPPSPPAGLYALDGIREYCPSCYETGHPTPRVLSLDRYLELRRAQYASQGLLK